MTFDPDYTISTPAVRQTENWTCSACSWAWLANSIGQSFTEWEAVQTIGYPTAINPQVGLVQGSGVDLVAAYKAEPRGWPAHNAYLSWEQATELAMAGPLLLGGHGFNHWVAVRGAIGETLWLANPAPRWFNVQDSLEFAEWRAYGPWSGVWLADEAFNVGPA